MRLGDDGVDDRVARFLRGGSAAGTRDVALFSQQESRDELGIGTVRDALSDAMFPGISVIQTRARYFLFAPWLFREGERRGYVGRDLVRWVDSYERAVPALADIKR